MMMLVRRKGNSYTASGRHAAAVKRSWGGRHAMRTTAAIRACHGRQTATENKKDKGSGADKHQPDDLQKPIWRYANKNPVLS